MALHQYWIDVQEEGRQKCKLQDAKDYEKLQQAWGLGPIKLSQKDNLLEINGIYVEDNRCKSVFLGQGSLLNAIRRVNRVKILLITHTHLFHLFVIELKHKQLLPI